MNMPVNLPNHWKARHYQAEHMNFMFQGGQFPTRKRSMEVWHRRAGKDSMMINTLAIASQMRVGTYWHLLPTLNQGRKVVWNGIDGQGRRMIFQGFPREMIESVNENEMTIKLKNDSIYQVVGSDNYNALVGANPLGVVMSEWAISDPNSWNFVRPILAENGGFASFITTPRGRNHAWDMWKMAQASPDWFTSHRTIFDTFRDDGTPVISLDIVNAERAEGVPEEVIQQEYFCSWEGVNFGSIYGRQLGMLKHHQIEFEVEFDPNLLVYTAWDLGRRDATAIWFYQIVRDEVHVIDFVEGTGGDVETWLEALRELPYNYGVPALPHDAKAKTFSTKYTTYETFCAAKWRPYVVPRVSVSDGIQAVRALLPQVWFNVKNPRVLNGLDHLEQYHYEYDEKLKVFHHIPAHDEHSHAADAFRMLALSQNVMEISSRSASKNNRKDPNYIQTPLGRALCLESLFRDRESSKSNRRV